MITYKENDLEMILGNIEKGPNSEIAAAISQCTGCMCSCKCTCSGGHVTFP